MISHLKLSSDGSGQSVSCPTCHERVTDVTADSGAAAAAWRPIYTFSPCQHVGSSFTLTSSPWHALTELIREAEAETRV